MSGSQSDWRITKLANGKLWIEKKKVIYGSDKEKKNIYFLKKGFKKS